ncbi:MAG: hypothetical protein VB055_10205 [Oscillospiraceae bacterium]|nr:hypothetical protein [Oscillospiraceae bacterium]
MWYDTEKPESESAMKLNVTTADPAGNVTLLVETGVDPADYGKVARRLLAMEDLRGEQVGFLTAPGMGGAVRLQMMGGEFCGNAARCAGLYQARRQGMERPGTVAVEMSGCASPLAVRTDLRRGTAEAEMPLPEGMERVTVSGRGMTAVRFAGIVHLVAACAPLPEREVAALLPELCRRFGAPAAGLMFLQDDFMRPAVYVDGTKSLCWESSCASGSAAAACARTAERPDGVYGFCLRQPGGMIEVCAERCGGRTASVRIGGRVTLEESREIEL